jgi:hypothetical protein
MKTKVVLTLSLVFVLGLVFSVSASAQIKAGSPEDKAFTAIDAEQNPAAKLAKLQDFEKTFPTSAVLPSIYQMEMDVYKQMGDTGKVNEVGEKLIKADPQNITALMAVSRNYAMAKTNLNVAVAYAQRAVDAVAKLKTTAAPPDQTDAQWQQYLTTLDNAAKAQLNYAKSVHP